MLHVYRDNTQLGTPSYSFIMLYSFAATGHANYAKYAQLYLQETNKLPDIYDVNCERAMDIGRSIQIVLDNISFNEATIKSKNQIKILDSLHSGHKVVKDDERW